MRCRPGLRSGAGPAELQQEICCETECLQLTAWANVSSGLGPAEHVGGGVGAQPVYPGKRTRCEPPEYDPRRSRVVARAPIA